MIPNSEGFKEFHNSGEYQVLEKLSSQDFKTILDVGANHGYWALMASKIFVKATIHCFEPIEQNQIVLKCNVNKKANIVTNEFGLLDREQCLVFKYYPEKPGLTSIYDYPHNHDYKFLKGKVRRGDDYVKENKLSRIDYLKIDTEGAENRVLAGLVNSFEEDRVGIVQFEYGSINSLSRFFLRDFYEFFENYGYMVGIICSNHVDFRDYEIRHENLMLANYLAVPKSQYDLMAVLSDANQ